MQPRIMLRRPRKPKSEIASFLAVQSRNLAVPTAFKARKKTNKTIFNALIHGRLFSRARGVRSGAKRIAARTIQFAVSPVPIPVSSFSKLEH
jgi:hypothetical protein